MSLPALDVIPEAQRLPRQLFETLHDGTHPLSIALQKLQTLDSDDFLAALTKRPAAKRENRKIITRDMQTDFAALRKTIPTLKATGSQLPP